MTVLIPAYNEEATIIQILEKVRAQSIDGVDFEVLVIDDGSSDSTASLVESRPDLDVGLIRRQANQGKGAAVIAGLEAATGDFILFQDADLEYDPDDYLKLLVPILKYEADIVIGSRLTAPQMTRVHYYWHRIGNQRITGLFNMLNNTTFTDIYSGYLVLRSSMVNGAELRSRGWEQQAEILSRAVRRARVIYEVPISYHGRSYSEGKKIRAHHALGVTWMIVRSRFRR